MLRAIIGEKIGMTQLFPEDGKAVAVTAILAGPAVVTQVKTREREGYDAVQLGLVRSGKRKVRLNSPEKGHVKGIEAEIVCLREFRSSDVGSVSRGDRVDVGFLKAGDVVNVVGCSKGKGFAGVVKRHHFSGGPKTHGQTDRHRAPGSIGATTYPGRVLKGQRMAGHMGARRATARNLEVVRVDPERNLLLLKGAVPGARGGMLYIKRVR